MSSNAFQRAALRSVTPGTTGTAVPGLRLQQTAKAAANLEPVDEAQAAHDEAGTQAVAEEPDPAILRLEADIRLLMRTPPYPSRAALEYVKAFLTDHQAAAAAGAAPVPAGAAQTGMTKTQPRAPTDERAEKIRNLQASMAANPLSIGSQLAKKDAPPQTMKEFGTKLGEWRKRSTSSDGTNGQFPGQNSRPAAHMALPSGQGCARLRALPCSPRAAPAMAAPSRHMGLMCVWLAHYSRPGQFFIEQNAESDYRFDANSRRQPAPDFVRLQEQKMEAERLARMRQR